MEYRLRETQTQADKEVKMKDILSKTETEDTKIYRAEIDAEMKTKICLAET